MNNQSTKHLHRPPLVAAIAAIVVSGIAIASLAISAQGSDEGLAAAAPAAGAVSAPAAAPAARGRACAECGVIESVRKIYVPSDKPGSCRSERSAAARRGAIEAEPLRNYEITIRLRDGSMRVIADARPAQWRQGEAVTIIAGANL